MSVDLGKNLIALVGIQPKVQAPVSVKPQAFKTAAYASIPYSKAPTVTDTVPTKDANGKPLLAGYCTPEKVWVA
jgi:hypothetical protein